ncbi:MAG: hypothetical protein Q4C70_03195 [Planctomycetia bacterium]|nr:hypothetical protein [Planctomycetia bacterium]
MKIPRKFTYFLLFFALCLSAVSASAQNPQVAAVLQSKHFGVAVAPNGMVVSVRDKSGKEWLDKNKPDVFSCIYMVKGQPAANPQLVEMVSGGKQLRVTYKNGAVALFNYESEKDYFTLEVADLTLPAGAENFYRLDFGNVHLAVDYTNPKTLGFSSLILTIHTNVADYPGQSSRLNARCYAESGWKGAKAAFVGIPEKDMRRVMQSVTEMILEKAEKDAEYRKIMPPVSRAGGGFAMDFPRNFGSYIITTHALTAEDAPEWMKHLEKFGVNQIDFHQGTTFRQGDFRFKPEAYPNGATDFKRMTDTLKKRGFCAGLHTYSCFLPKHSPYITPVPHKDLDVMRTFTLAQNIDEKVTEIPVTQSTKDVSTVLGYTIRNSLFLRIENEIIRFESVSDNGFVKCERGALGTQAASHTQGAQVGHLSQYFTAYFTPNPKSELFLEIARNTAKAYDEGGFSMIYLDALDGVGAQLEDREMAWYYNALFVREILTNIKSEPPLLEYSTMHPSLWAARSRMGAWDSPTRGFNAFFARHAGSNARNATKNYLPAQLGWFALCPPRTKDVAPCYQCQPLYRDHLEYLGSILLTTNSGMSYLDISPGTLLPATEMNGEILRTYDILRREEGLPREFRKFTPTPGNVIHLKKQGKKTLAVRARYVTLDAFRDRNLAENPENADEMNFTVENPFRKPQRPYIRLENLHAVETAESATTKPMELVTFDENQPVEKVKSQNWPTPINLQTHLGLGMWVYGDGQGQILNIRVGSPKHKSSGYNDHYARLDHKGWKFLEFAEAENGAYPEITWPIVNAGLYPEFRTRVQFDTISDVHVMVHGPTEGLKFRTLSAYSIRATTWKNPTILLNGKKVMFRGEIPTGCHVEIDTDKKVFTVRDATGNEVGKIQPTSPIPKVEGKVEVQILTTPDAPRIRCTLGFYE